MRDGRGLVGAFLVVAIGVGVLATSPISQQVQLDLNTSDRNASEGTRQTLRRLGYFCDKPSAGILSGQNIGTVNGNGDLGFTFRHTWTKLTAFRGCPEPAVMTIDLADEIPRRTGFIVNVFQSHFKDGGFVGMSMHPPNPWTGGDSWDKANVSFKDLMTPGTKANQKYRLWLRGIAGILEDLQRRDVTVLWRPLHEANGYWFWWCYGAEETRISEVQYKQLWISMHNYFHKDRGLHNLLWVYSPNVITESDISGFDKAYPGSEYVDIVSLDYYGPDVKEIRRRGSYDRIRQFGKVIALSEYGSKPWNGSLDAKRWLQQIRSSFPHFAYFCSWHSWPGASVALADLDEAPQLLGHDFVVNLEDIKHDGTQTRTIATGTQSAK